MDIPLSIITSFVSKILDFFYFYCSILDSCSFGFLTPFSSQDMLVFLYHEGSWTRGIFRRSAGARAIRELRDSLDGGEAELPLSRDHVFIIAGVFKVLLQADVCLFADPHV